MASASKGPVYGYYTQADDAAQYLKENTKTQFGGNFWNQQYHAVDSNVSATNAELTLGETAANQKLMDTYSKNVADATQAAYEMSRHTKNDYFGVKQSDINDSVAEAMNSAYEQYRQQYLSDSSDVFSQYSTARNQYADYFQKQYDALDTTLAGEGKNLAAYQNYIPDYIVSHWDQLQTSPEFMKIAQDMTDGRTPTKGEITQYMYDDNGLTPYGKMMYQFVTTNPDMLDEAGGKIERFGEWLAAQDQDLANWAASAGYDQSGKSMAQMARQSTGLDAFDELYNEGSYYLNGSYTTDQLIDIFDEYSKQAVMNDDGTEKSSRGNYTEFLSKLNQGGSAEEKKAFVEKYNAELKNSMKNGVRLDIDSNGNVIVEGAQDVGYEGARLRLSEFNDYNEVYNEHGKLGAGTKDGKQVWLQKNFYNDAMNGKIADGTVIDLNLGAGTKYFTYYNGAIYEGKGEMYNGKLYMNGVPDSVKQEAKTGDTAGQDKNGTSMSANTGVINGVVKEFKDMSDDEFKNFIIDSKGKDKNISPELAAKIDEVNPLIRKLLSVYSSDSSTNGYRSISANNGKNEVYQILSDGTVQLGSGRTGYKYQFNLFTELKKVKNML